MVEITAARSFQLFGVRPIRAGTRGFLSRWSPRLKHARDGNSVPVRFPEYTPRAFIVNRHDIQVPRQYQYVLENLLAKP